MKNLCDNKRYLEKNKNVIVNKKKENTVVYARKEKKFSKKLWLAEKAEIVRCMDINLEHLHLFNEFKEDESLSVLISWG